MSKKQKNGNTVTTPVFKHNVDYKTNIRIEKTKSLDAFTFYPGENLGVHVYDCKVIDIKTAKKKFKQSKKINNQIDSLNLRRDSLIKKQEEYIKVYNRADTIAKIKLKQRVMARTYSK